ncbi:MAG: DUF4430 domain-containing protein [Candidatus Magasanikbacteria bacterium]|nr:DUF4430 domain-containing protein [Candidatus Magasanikbacteria bacterium]
MPNSNKLLHRLLIFLIFISVFAATYLFLNPDNNNASPPLYTAPTNTAAALQTEPDLKPAVLKNKTSDSNEKTVTSSAGTNTASNTSPLSPPPPTNSTETIPVTFKIEDREYNPTVKPGATAYEAMVALRESNEISFSTKVFSGLGHFVEEINSQKNSPSTGFYWTFYINNEEAKVGISNYTLKPNDLITWRYENK